MTTLEALKETSFFLIPLFVPAPKPSVLNDEENAPLPLATSNNPLVIPPVMFLIGYER